MSERTNVSEVNLDRKASVRLGNTLQPINRSVFMLKDFEQRNL